MEEEKSCQSALEAELLTADGSVLGVEEVRTTESALRNLLALKEQGNRFVPLA